MTSSRSAYTHVWLPGSENPVLCGRLDEKDGGAIDFTYARSYLDRSDAIALDPDELALQRGRVTPPLGDLHGILRDAAPDAWGRRVQLARAGDTPLMELDFLLGASVDRIGALAVTQEPDPPAVVPSALPSSLQTLMTAAERIEANEPLTADLESALLHGTSVGGARPKALVADESSMWVAKFSSSTDPYPVVRCEHAAMRLAAACGLEVPAVRGMQVAGRDVLLVERFDRVRTEADWSRRLMVSALTCLRLHETEARLASYLDLAAFIRRRAAQPAADNLRLFRRMVFNILVGNTDDHARNHAFFWDGRAFELTPAYDLCPFLRAGRTASQAMIVGVHGRASTLRNARSEAGQFGISAEAADALIEELVAHVHDHWPKAAQEAGLSANDRARLERETILGPGCFEEPARGQVEPVGREDPS